MSVEIGKYYKTEGGDIVRVFNCSCLFHLHNSHNLLAARSISRNSLFVFYHVFEDTGIATYLSSGFSLILATASSTFNIGIGPGFGGDPMTPQEFEEILLDEEATYKPRKPKCECGAVVAKTPFHADWCEMYVDPNREVERD